MSFTNRIRLPFQTKKAQFPSERNIFRRADGSTKVLSVVIRHTYEMKTDYLPEEWHKRLVIALSHDTVNIENENYIGDVSIDGDYNIEWQDFLNYPVAQATAVIQVTPFDATNSNCQTCDQAQQLDLVDDTFPDPIDEGDEAIYPNVLSNDSICCYPSVVTLVSFNTTYLDSATLTPEGELTIQVKAETGSAAAALLATYRVTCPDGSYDEANIYGEIVGTASGCGEPSGIVIEDITQTTADVSWSAAIPAPAVGYVWNLFLASDPVTPVQTGTTAGLTVTLGSLISSTNYIFQVYSDCGDGNYSASIVAPFTTEASEVGAFCGQYNIVFNRTSPGAESASVSYLNCDVQPVNEEIFVFLTYTRCIYQYSPGVPVFFSASSPDVEITYFGPC